MLGDVVELVDQLHEVRDLARHGRNLVSGPDSREGGAMQTRTLATEAGDVTIREWGREATQGDRLLLALHSMGPVSTGALYNCAVGPLVEAGYHVVAPDLPGYGLSPALPPDEYDVARLADRLWLVSDALGAARITLVGHSWGGAIAMRMQMECGPACRTRWSSWTAATSTTPT